VKDLLVTGAAGQLGTAIANQVAGHPQIKLHLANRNELDITDPISVSDYFAKNQMDGVINCAAYTAVDLAESHREEAFLVNAEGAKNIAQACQESDTPLYHISTDYVFDGIGAKPYTEQDAINPKSVYGASKAEGERLIRDVCPEACIIRTSWLVDAEGQNFVNTMIKLGSERDSISIVDDQVASPTWAPLLADGLLTAISHEANLSGTFHYAHEGECSWKKFAEYIFKNLDIQCQVNAISTQDFGAAAPRPKYSKLDTTKLKAIGHFTFPTWEEASTQFLQPTK
jgi:dTDP-4-dehydrorhamnose reductase